MHTRVKVLKQAQEQLRKARSWVEPLSDDEDLQEDATAMLEAVDAFLEILAAEIHAEA